MRVFADVAAGACILLFLAAALGKFDRWAEWSRLSEEIPVPTLVRRAIRLIVPAAEIVIVALTIAAPGAGLGAGGVVLAVFAIAVWVLARELEGRECNCFGAVAPGTISARLALRNATLALLAGGGWYLASTQRAPALSLGAVVATGLTGAVVLTVFQYRSLLGTARAVNEPKEVE